MRGDIVGVRGDDRGLNCSKCRGEDTVLLGVAGREFNAGGNGKFDWFCNTESSLISLATRAMSCSTGTLDVPSGI